VNCGVLCVNCGVLYINCTCFIVKNTHNLTSAMSPGCPDPIFICRLVSGSAPTTIDELALFKG
jgi:hypothetical protein